MVSDTPASDRPSELLPMGENQWPLPFLAREVTDKGISMVAIFAAVRNAVA